MSIEDSVDFKKFFNDLPIGAYWVDNNGVIIYINDSGKQIMGYDLIDDLKGQNINIFYQFPEDREKMLKLMDKNHGKIINETIKWKKRNNNNILVSDSAHYTYSENKEKNGLFGIFIDVNYRDLIDGLCAGFYQIGPDQKTIFKVNPAVSRMFGYSDPHEMEGMDVTQLYEKESDKDDFIEQLKKNKSVENYKIKMKKKNGETIFILINARLLIDDNKRIIGREGTFTDITYQQKYIKYLEDSPTGTYEVKIIDEEPIIIECNPSFARILGYDSNKSLTNISIHDLYFKRKDIRRFENALIEEDRNGKPLCNYRLRVKGNNVDFIWIEIDCLILRDLDENITGRQGTIRDITDTMKVEKLMKNRKDVQRFIHSFMAPLMNIVGTSQILLDEMKYRNSGGISEYRSEKPYVINKDIMQTFNKIKETSNQLLERLIELSDRLVEKNRDSYEINCVNEAINTLTSVLEKDIIENIVILRKRQRDIYEILNDLSKKKKNDKEIYESINACQKVLQVLNDMYIHYLVEIIISKSKVAFYDVEGVRNQLLRWDEEVKEPPYVFKRCNLYECIRDAVNIYQVDASLKQAKIQMPTNFIPKIDMDVVSVKRLFSMIIQNAVKYSYYRKGFIAIRAEDMYDRIKIEVENYGVGLGKEEIDSEKIFEYGYRGIYSTDYSRVGSGIGLPEAKRIMEKHHGEITIESVPVNKKTTIISKETPHMTTVTLIFPKEQSGEK